MNFGEIGTVGRAPGYGLRNDHGIVDASRQCFSLPLASPMARVSLTPPALAARRIRMSNETGLSTRRDFTGAALESLTTLALVEGLWSRQLLGAGAGPVVDDWFKELDTISRDVHEHRLRDVEFQGSLERLYKRVDLAALLKTLDFDRMAAVTSFPAKGARSLPVDFSHVSGLPAERMFGSQIFAVKRGRSVVPHGHDNMATGFLVLKGTFHGRHYDRVADHPDHYIIRPSIDHNFRAGEFSTISDHKDNVHWFIAESETAFIFNVHVTGTDAGSSRRPVRVYIDPMGEKLAGGLIKAPKISYGKVNQLYG
jgi:hypothetical protein